MLVNVNALRAIFSISWGLRENRAKSNNKPDLSLMPAPVRLQASMENPGSATV